MGLTPGAVEDHIRTWESEFRREPRRRHWPAFLFHAAHVTTAARILKAGELVCREDLGRVDHDVANPGAVQNNPAAHGYVRLYFRPRTPFHLRTEGIKCLGDRYRLGHQMSIPVMLAFDARSVLTLDGVGFSRETYARKQDLGCDDEFFSSIPFAEVYHDSYVADPGRWEVIKSHRMAEVLHPRRLPLAPHLKWIICRTLLERETLLHLLGLDMLTYAPMIVTESVLPSIFLHRGLYLRSLDFQEDTLRVEIHPPTDGPLAGHYILKVYRWIDHSVEQRWRGTLPADRTSLTLMKVIPVGGGLWTLHLEGELAYQGPLIHSVASELR